MTFSFGLNPTALPQLFIAVFLLVQGLLVFAQNRHSPLNRSFFFFELAVFVWLVGMGLNYLAIDPETADFFSRIGFLGVVYIPVATYLVSVYYLGDARQKPLAFTGLAVTFLYSLFIGSESMATGVYAYSWGYYIKLAPFGVGGLLLFLLFAPLFLRNFYLRYRAAAPHARRWHYLAFTSGALSFLAVVDFLPGFGVPLPVPPIGFLFVGTMATLMGYFILRYRLVDIKIIVGRGIGHSLLTALLLLVYGSFFVLFSPFDATMEHLLFDAAFFIIALYLFAPLKERSQKIVDELFTKERINFDRLVSDFIVRLRNLTDTATLAANLSMFLSEKLRIESSATFVLEANERRWKLYQGIPRAAGGHEYRDTAISLADAELVAKNPQPIDSRGSADPRWSNDPLVSEITSILFKRREVAAFPLVHRGIFLGFLSIGERISRRDFTSDELGALERLTGPLAIALENARAYEAIELASKSKNDFVTIISHQLRTPLTNIKWATETLLGDKTPLQGEARTFIERISASADAMVRLIGQLLNTLSASKEGVGAVIGPADVLRILQDVEAEHRPLMNRKSLHFVTSFPTELLAAVRGNPEYVRIVLAILLDNAMRYAPSSRTVELRAVVKDERTLEFHVSDTGIGIPDAEQARVFEKFFRANNAISLVPDGTGLGLFYAKQLVEAQGGQIWFRSKEGQGTSVYFSLPLAGEKTK